MNNSTEWSDLLKGSEDNVELARIVQSISESIERGDAINLEQIVAAHPAYKPVLQELLPTLEDLLRFGKASDLADQNPSMDIPKNETLGDFRIIRELGRGGMGIVYEAEQRSLSRRVALKILPLAGLLHSSHLRRFTNEAKAAASLKHPNIVSVHGVGCERGIHYYAMELVEGQTMAQLIQQLKKQEKREIPRQRNSDVERHSIVETLPVAELSTQRSRNRRSFYRAVAHLGIQIAEALNYAHQHGVVHRDIKPANVLLDGDGKPWVTDFGLAQIHDDASLTITGDVLGTIRYMSPEQAAGNRVLSHRSDIYSLGITLYELLTLQPAFDESNRQQLMRKVIELPPHTPRKLQQSIPVDLETIVLKATEKHPEDRYETARQLADDLRRFLEDRPLCARRPSVHQRTMKWARRHKSLVATTTGVIFLVLIVMTVASSILTARLHGVAKRERQIADRERTARVNVDLANARISAQSKRVAELLSDSYVDKAQLLCEQGEVGAGMLWLAHSLQIAPSEATNLRRAIRASLAAWHGQIHKLESILQHSTKVSAVAFGPDNRRIVTGCVDGTARIWDVAAGKVVAGPFAHDEEVSAVAFSPDGEYVATGALDGELRIWKATTGTVIGNPLPHGESIRTVMFSSDGKEMLTTSSRTSHLWDVSTLKAVDVEHYGDNRPLVGAAFTREGLRVLRVVPGGTVQMWDPIHSKPVGDPTTDRVRIVWSAAIAADSLSFVLGSSDQNIQRWGTATGRQIGEPIQNGSTVWTMALSPDDSRLLAGPMDSAARVWDVNTQQPIGQPLKHLGVVKAVAYSRDGSRMVTAGEDGSARVWIAAQSSSVRLPIATTAIDSIEVSPDGSRLAFLRSDRTCALMDIATGHLTVIPFRGCILSMAFSPDGTQVATGCSDKTVRRWNVLNGVAVGQALRHQGWVHSVAYSTDGKEILAGCTDTTAQLWDVRTGERIGEPLEHANEVIRVAFGPNGSRLLTGCADGSVRLWDARTLQPISESLRGFSKIRTAIFDPTGNRILVGHENGAALITDIPSRQTVGQPIQHKLGLLRATFSRDSCLVLTGGLDGMVRTWDANTGKPVGPPRPYGDQVHGLGICPNGEVLVTGKMGDVAIWRTTSSLIEGEVERVVLWAQVITGLELEFDAGGTVRVLNDSTWRARRRRLQQLGGPPLISGMATVDQNYKMLAHRLSATDAMSHGLWRESAVHMDRALAHPTATWRDRLTRARALAHVDRWEDAERDFERVVAVKGENSQTWIERGSVYLELGHAQKAEVAFGQALDLLPDSRQELIIGAWWKTVPTTHRLDNGLLSEADFSGSIPFPLSSSMWRPALLESDGFLSFGEQFDNADTMSAYAVTSIYSKEDQQVALLIGSSDELKVWLNGEMVHEYPHARYAFANQDIALVSLRRGWNTVLVQVTKVVWGYSYGLFPRFSHAVADQTFATGFEQARKGQWLQSVHSLSRAMVLSDEQERARRRIASMGFAMLRHLAVGREDGEKRKMANSLSIRLSWNHGENNWSAALAVVEEAINGSFAGAGEGFFLAVLYAYVGDMDGARRCYERADLWLKENQLNEATSRRLEKLRGEVDGLIQGPPADQQTTTGNNVQRPAVNAGT